MSKEYNRHLRQQTDSDVEEQIALENLRASLAAEQRDRLQFLVDQDQIDGFFNRIAEGRSAT